MVSGRRAVASQWKSRNPSSAKASQTGPCRIHLTVDGGSRDSVGKSGIERGLSADAAIRGGGRGCKSGYDSSRRVVGIASGGEGGSIHLLKKLLARKIGRRITSSASPPLSFVPIKLAEAMKDFRERPQKAQRRGVGIIGHETGPGPRRPPRSGAGCGPQAAGRWRHRPREVTSRGGGGQPPDEKRLGWISCIDLVTGGEMVGPFKNAWQE